MKGLFLFPDARRNHPQVEQWFCDHNDELGTLAKHWFKQVRSCADDVCECLHDGHPTACVGQAAFAYVDVFTSHVNIGFYRGVELIDPTGLLQGSGKLMRHVKLGPDKPLDRTALEAIILAAYDDMRIRITQS